MSAPAHIARENGKKGGRPRGLNAINAEKGKAKLIEMYLAKVVPINQVLIDKALAGDITAIKELHDRVYGKSMQPVTGADGGPIQIVQISGVQIKKD